MMSDCDQFLAQSLLSGTQLRYNLLDKLLELTVDYHERSSKRMHVLFFLMSKMCVPQLLRHKQNTMPLVTAVGRSAPGNQLLLR